MPPLESSGVHPGALAIASTGDETAAEDRAGKEVGKLREQVSGGDGRRWGCGVLALRRGV